MSRETTTYFTLDANQPPSARRKDLKALDAMADEAIDYSDIPELSSDFWHNLSLLRPAHKKALTLRVDEDVLDWFKAQGKGYQTYMNAVLRAFTKTHGTH